MNSNSRRYLSVLAILLALPAQAQTPPPKPAPAPAPAKPKTTPAKPESPTPRARIETAFEAARVRVLAGDTDRAPYEELVGAINGSYGALAQSTPDASTVRTRIIAGLDDIYARAKTGKIAPEEFSALRVEMLDAQMHTLLAEAATGTGEKGSDVLGTGLKQLADASQELDPATMEWRTRAQTLLDDLKKKPAIEPADLEPLSEELTHAATMRSEAWLEKRATAKSATPIDFARVRNHMSDLLDMQGQKDPSARELKQKLSAAIDELEQKSSGAALTRAEFESLKKELVQRGRAAMGEKPKPKG
jgi:hypothetical protein